MFLCHNHVNDECMNLGCGSGEVLLTDNRTLAPPDLVEASNSLDNIGAGATNIYNINSGATWCTDNSDHDPYIDMQFTSPVLISTMLSRGSTLLSINAFSCSLRMYHVTNFTLEYSLPDNSSMLNYYTSTDEQSAANESESIKVSMYVLS